MPISRQQIDDILIPLRLTLLELMVMRLQVAVTVWVSKRPVAQEVSGLEAELEEIAAQLERSVIPGDPRLLLLSDADRALVQDEFREMLEGMKDRLRQLFASSLRDAP